MLDYYEILGVSFDSDQRTVHKTYLRVALIAHPDKVPENQRDEATKKFQVISEAYAVLYDPEKRRAYDLQRSLWSHETSPQFSRRKEPSYEYTGNRKAKYQEEKKREKYSSYFGEDDAFFEDLQRQGPSAFKNHNNKGGAAKFYKNNEKSAFDSSNDLGKPSKPPVLKTEERDGELCVVVTLNKVSGATSYRLEMRVEGGNWTSCYEGPKDTVVVSAIQGSIPSSIAHCFYFAKREFLKQM